MQAVSSGTSGGKPGGMWSRGDKDARSGDDGSGKDTLIFSGAPVGQQRLLRALVARRDCGNMDEDAEN